MGLEIIGAVAGGLAIAGAIYAFFKGRAMLEARAVRNTEKVDDLDEFVNREIAELKGQVDRSLEEIKAEAEKDWQQFKSDYERDREITHDRIQRHSDRLDKYIESSVDIKTTLASVQTLVSQLVDRIDRFEQTVSDALRARSAGRHE